MWFGVAVLRASFWRSECGGQIPLIPGGFREGCVTPRQVLTSGGLPAVKLIEATELDVMLLDVRMPRLDGLWTLRRLRALQSTVPVLVLTTLAAGGTLISPAITERVLRAVRWGSLLPDLDELPAQELTKRETEVLRLVAQGYGNRQIADVLFLAEGTVKNHRSSILAKLGTRDRTNAVLKAMQGGILNSLTSHSRFDDAMQKLK